MIQTIPATFLARAQVVIFQFEDKAPGCRPLSLDFF